MGHPSTADPIGAQPQCAEKPCAQRASPAPAGLPPPRSAYIHVPFCRHRCGYCNFTLVAGRDDLVEPYLAALERELSALQRPRPVETLFCGGGTPTHLPLAALRRLLDLVLTWHPLAAQGEFSLEANPSDVAPDIVDLLAERGVTRLSLGAQSFDVRALQLLERDHRPQTIANAVGLSRAARLDVSLDLIFGVPGQTIDQWNRDLDAAIALEPDHLSTYGLTFEQGTSFWNRRRRGTLQPVDEELEREMYALAIDRLGAAGFEHYEVSNFARPDKRCRHNEAYWAGDSYYAAGPGAARYLEGVRETNHRSVAAWLRRIAAGQSPVAESECLSDDDRARELAVFGLRRMAGVDRRWFFQKTGRQLDALLGPPLERFVALGLLDDDGRAVRLTREGLFVSDSMWPEFLG